MKHNSKADEAASVLRQTLRQGIISDEHPLNIFINLQEIKKRLKILKDIFPAGTLHAVAMKANPLHKILELLKDEGAATETASFGELLLALNSGYPADKIIYDSPVKTHAELEYAISKGVHVNIDSLAELERIKKLLAGKKINGTFGLRINPQTGLGTIATSSVAGVYSKFGVPVNFRRQEIIDAFLQNDWLTGVHLHVGSQGCSPEMLVKSAETVFSLAKEINQKAGKQQINIFDLGGGFPVSYKKDTEAPAIEDYASSLKSHIPELFSSGWKIITEFGRWVHVNAGFTISRVEYLKDDGGYKTAMLHAGADLFLRECLLPSDWQHEYTVLDREGNIRNENFSEYTLAGPLCFSGDILAKNVSLPEIQEGDFIVIHDTGGYTFSMWSRYNSRFFPPVIAYDEERSFLLREQETPEQLADFWR